MFWRARVSATAAGSWLAYRCGDDGAAALAEVEGLDAGQPIQAGTQVVAKATGTCADGVEPEIQGLADRGAESDHVDVAVLPGLEATCTVNPGEAPVAVPGG